MTTGRIEAVLLDVGGVLVLPEPTVLLPAVHAAGAAHVTPTDLARAHYAGVAAMDTSALANESTAWPVYTRALVEALGVEGDTVGLVHEAVEAAYEGMAWTGTIPGAIEGLRRLADTGVALGIVSNSNGTVEEQLLRTKICQVGEGAGVRVTVVLDSFVVGVEKPDPAIFLRALEVLGVRPDRAIHVGDTGWADVVGARAAGVRPVHLDPHGFCPNPDDHEHVSDLDGVVALVIGDAAGGVSPPQ
jgi:putative hydrolase of the HAD superfamily